MNKLSSYSKPLVYWFPLEISSHSSQPTTLPPAG